MNGNAVIVVVVDSKSTGVLYFHPGLSPSTLTIDRSFVGVDLLVDAFTIRGKFN